MRLMVFLLAFVAVSTQVRADFDPAELFPEETRFYAEIVQPDRCVESWEQLLKSPAASVIVKKHHERVDAIKRADQYNGLLAVGPFSLLNSREALAELKKIRSVALAVKFSDELVPSGVMAIRLADDSALGLLVRYYQTSESVRKVGAAGDVPIFQWRSFVRLPGESDPDVGPPAPRDRDPALPDPTRPEAGTGEWTFAYVPGLLVVGDDVPSVADVLQRFQKRAIASLATSKTFEATAKLRERPGLVLHADVKTFLRLSSERMQKHRELVEPDWLAYFRTCLGLKTCGIVRAVVRLDGDDLTVVADIPVERAQDGPLLPLLAQDGRSNLYPGNWSATMTLTKENRTKGILTFLDAVGLAEGRSGNAPSERIAELDSAKQKPLIAELLPTISSVTLVQLPKSTPALILEVEEEKLWEEPLERLVDLLSRRGQRRKAATETINGVKVYSFGAAIHFTQVKGRIVLAGEKATVVALALAVPSVQKGPAAGSLHLGAVVEHFFPKPLTERVNEPRPGYGLPQEQSPFQKGDYYPALARAASRSWAPVELTLQRSGTQLRLEGRTRQVAKSILKSIDNLEAETTNPSNLRPNRYRMYDEYGDLE